MELLIFWGELWSLHLPEKAPDCALAVWRATGCARSPLDPLLSIASATLSSERIVTDDGPRTQRPPPSDLTASNSQPLHGIT